MENKNKEHGRSLFYLVVVIAILIVTLVGATFAYFVSTSGSENSAIKTGSATVKLNYISYTSGWQNNDLIPVDTLVAEYSFENQSDLTITDETKRSNTLCKDDNGNSVCSVYVFQVINSSNTALNTAMDVVSEVNGFSNLQAMIYEVAIKDDRSEYDSLTGNNGDGDPLFKNGASDTTDNAIEVLNETGTILDNTEYTPVYVNRGGVNKTLLKYIKSKDTTTGSVEMVSSLDIPLVMVDDTNVSSDDSSRTSRVADEVTIPGNTTKTFALVLYIKNLEEDQTVVDSAKNYSGHIVIATSDGSSKITGKIGAVNDSTTSNLQSNQ